MLWICNQTYECDSTIYQSLNVGYFFSVEFLQFVTLNKLEASSGGRKLKDTTRSISVSFSFIEKKNKLTIFSPIGGAAVTRKNWPVKFSFVRSQ